MRRRQFLISSSALMLVPGFATAYPAETFSPDLWRDLREVDQVVILNFRASWSLTCQIKADILSTLLQNEPSYRRITFVDVDWDTFGPSVLTQRLKVNRRSTLLVMREGREIARLENEPYERRIRALLDKALAA